MEKMKIINHGGLLSYGQLGEHGVVIIFSSSVLLGGKILIS
jgi:hypothetical protein